MGGGSFVHAIQGPWASVDYFSTNVSSPEQSSIFSKLIGVELSFCCLFFLNLPPCFCSLFCGCLFADMFVRMWAFVRRVFIAKRLINLCIWIHVCGCIQIAYLYVYMSVWMCAIFDMCMRFVCLQVFDGVCVCVVCVPVCV